MNNLIFFSFVLKVLYICFDKYKLYTKIAVTKTCQKEINDLE